MNSANALILLSSSVAQVGIQHRDVWTWHDVAFSPAASAQINADALVTALHAGGFRGGGLVLGVPAKRCLTATFDVSDLPNADYKTRLFRFEEQLPLAAEQVVAEFIERGSDATAARLLGVAVERAWLEPLVAAIESSGFAVDAVTPTTLLAVGLGTSTSNEATLIAEPGDAQWQLILAESARASHWLHIPNDSAALKQALQALRLRGVEIEALRCVPILPEVDIPPNIAVINETRSFQSLAAENAAKALRGQLSLIDFRRNGLPATDRLRLNRRAIDAMLVSVGIMLTLLTASLVIRSARYRGVSERNQQLMMTRFHETLPGWPTPSNFRAVVSSERRRLAPATSGAEAGPTALAMMMRILQPLPSSTSVTLNELSFAARHFDLAGTIDRYESAQPLVDVARESGLDIAPVQAHRISDHAWQFTLSGQIEITGKAAQR